jgi:undecaprenyl-diphosphatase
VLEFLRSADTSLFVLINSTLANPVFDAVMPWLTDWHQTPVGIALAAAAICMLLWKGGKKGRIVVLLLALLILITDQLSSSVIKSLVARPRPCHVVDGAQVVATLRLLVDCGSGYSFPSSHAVNNFAMATFLSYYYRRYAPWFYLFAFVMGLSRIVVGVHFPSDVACGAIIGSFIAWLVIGLWNVIGRALPAVAIGPGGGTGSA